MLPFDGAWNDTKIKFNSVIKNIFNIVSKICQVLVIRILVNLPNFYQAEIRMNWDLYDFEGGYGYCIEIQTLKIERIFGTVISC